MVEFIKLTLRDETVALFNRRHILVVSLGPMTLVTLKCLDEEGQVIQYAVKETFEEIQKLLVGEPG